MSQDGQSKINYLKTPDEFKSLEALLVGTPPPKKHLSSGLVKLEKAPNQVVFIESENFLAAPELYPAQFEIVRDFFELLCPHCNDIEKIKLVGNIPREDQVLFEFDICPKCGLRKLDIMDQLQLYNELIGVIGMRSGKSVVAAEVGACLTHEALWIDNLQERLGIINNQQIDGAFVASTGEQSAETVFDQFKSLYDESPWFQNYKKALMDLETSDPRFRRGTLYRDSDRYIWWKDKNIKLKAMTSNSGSSAGKTRLFTIIDEMSRLDAGESKRSATEVYRVFKRSLMTMKSICARAREKGDYSVPDAKMIVMSSPLFADDKSMQLLALAEKQSKMYACRKATWEANPTITKEDLADEYEADPIGAERDYGANPPGAENPFVKNPAIIEACIDKNKASILDIKEVSFDENVNGHIFKYIKAELTNVRFKNLLEYVIHCDPGKSFDSFCLAIGHRENNLVSIDGAFELRPIPKGNRWGLDPRIVYFPSIVPIILKLRSLLSIKVVTYDRWNSEEQIQQLRSAGILAISKDIDRDDHNKFLHSMEMRSIIFPKRENDNMDSYVTRNMPCAKALKELLQLNDNGVKVDHRSGGHNDMIQCYIGVHRALVSPDKIFTKKELATQQVILNKETRSHHKGGVGRVIRVRR